LSLISSPPASFASTFPYPLWSLRHTQDWHGIFLRFDKDHSGLIDRKELHQALLGFGFSLPAEMVKKLEKRFSPPPAPGGPPSRGISFDRFLMACVTVKHFTESFRRADVRNEGRLTLDYNQFVSAQAIKCKGFRSILRWT
jgi:Ca2+-binding EF-hand superfamily protein